MIDADQVINGGAPALTPSRQLARRQRFRVVRYVLRRDPLACFLVTVFLLAALIGPYVAPYSMTDTNILSNLQSPNSAHLLGTDQYGRDILSRLLGAARVAAEAALIVILIGGGVGIVLGGVSGLLGGKLDALISRVIEIVQGFPTVLLAIAIIAITGPSFLYAMLAVGIAAIPDFARISRSVALQLRTREFVEAARSVGSGEMRILAREILPIMLSSLVVIATFDGAQAIAWEATLSFLGLGVQPPAPSFGNMLSDAQQYLYQQPWFAIVCAIALAMVILGLNLLGDALSDYFESRGRR